MTIHVEGMDIPQGAAAGDPEGRVRPSQRWEGQAGCSDGPGRGR